ncbi:ankyrin repeat domain-containing protein 17 isoform X12 [Tenebrio molitor]|uniref:ankyrin repeat domain-containing protein 17 isoform X12 n=1 Tax=Tenebrio molitor TaxID=7067 RepID=UPI0036247E65
MQNVSQESSPDNPKIDKVNVHHDIGNLSSTPHSTSNSSPAKSETETYSEHRRYMSDSSESEEDSVSEDSAFSFEDEKLINKLLEEVTVEVESFMIDQEFEEDTQVVSAKYLLNPDEDRAVDPETQARLEALLQAAGISQLAAKDGKHLADPEVLRRLTSSVSCALDEAAAALTRMRSDNPRAQPEKTSLVEACTDGDVGTVRKLLTEGRSVHETSDEGESLLSLACSAGYYELAQVLLAMHANVEDRGIKGECTPLMEAASAGHLDIVKLLVKHGADVNAQSTSGNTPLMYGCAGGHTKVVEFLLENGANVEDHNENGHTPLMEAASAGHVDLAKILLKRGAGINTHSNEFKESALTLACYKGHLEMVRFLLEAGADQEHKTDEMHTALMEASMDGHVEVARLLLDSGAQVNMPTDSFESPLTLAACGGHVDLAMLLIERGANIEEVNDEGYTPLMEAAREGHEEMVHLLLGQGANINAQTDETQETALTLACCGGFTEVADILLKGGADIELGASTPLMEAAQEGHLDLVKFLLENEANVHAQTQTGDTALTYACENGHTDVADYLLQYGADLEHESEGGRTPLMKACRAGHMCTVQFLISKGANVRRQTTNNDHTPLSLACAGGHLSVVELLLSHNADPCHKLKDNSTMLIEAAKGGHTNVVQLLLDYPHSMQHMMINQHQQGATTATNLSMLPGQVGSRDSPLPPGAMPPNLPAQPINFFPPPQAGVLQEVPEAVRIVPQDDSSSPSLDVSKQQVSTTSSRTSENQQNQTTFRKSLLAKSRSTGAVFDGTLTSAEAQQVRTQPLPLTDFEEEAMEFLNKEDPNRGATCLQSPLKLAVSGDTGTFNQNQTQPAFYFTPLTTSVALPTASTTTTQPIKFQSVTSHAEVSQNTAISDRPKAKAVSKKEGKNLRKQQLQQQYQANLYGQQSTQVFSPIQLQQQPQQPGEKTLNISETLNVQGLDLDSIDQESLVLKEDSHENLLTASILQQFQNTSIRAAFVGSPQQKTRLDLYDHVQDGKVTKLDITEKDFSTVDDVVQTLESFNTSDINDQSVNQHNLQVQPYPSAIDETMLASFAGQQELQNQTDLSRVEYFAVPTNGAQVPVHTLYPYEHYLTTAGMPNKEQSGAIYQAGFQAGINLMQQQLACPSASTSETITTATVVPTTVGSIPGTSAQPYITPQQVACAPQVQTPCSHVVSAAPIQTAHHCQSSCTQHQQLAQTHQQQVSHQVQAATQTPQTANEAKKPGKAVEGTKVKKGGRVVRHQNQNLQGNNFQQNQNYQVGPNNAAITQYNGVNQQCQNPLPCLDVDSKTDSNHDTALTLACAGGHDDLVELLINRGADIEHRDKKGFTPLILAATAGHEKVVEVLLNHNADIEAQSERTKDTPLSLACSGGRYEVVELLLNRNANKEHRNVSDYTPLSLAASGGYVNIIKLLLSHGAEINSRTGSKLGISPLMLAAMNGHTAAVKLLLDMGSDINAQIETNRNTALTLACFQGRHEVVSLLLDRKANVEHRAKTGLTPLMEAASGGYVEVGRVLLDKGADVNATPVPSSRDTALTIAADKGHVRFVELLLCRGAQIEVKNKKGNSPLWLAANGGHLAVVELLYNISADIDSQDNRKVSCLMAAFRKGHVKVVKWMVHHVTQFPSDQEMIRYIATVSDKELLEKCQECVKIIRAAKETQAAKANKNATILLEELDMEKNREETKRLAAARRRERKKKKKLEKKEERRKLLEENKKNENYDDKDKKINVEDEKGEEEDNVQDVNMDPAIRNGDSGDKEEGDSGIDANSQGSCSSNDIKPNDKRKDKKKKKANSNSKNNSPSTKAGSSKSSNLNDTVEKRSDKSSDSKNKSVQHIRKGLVFEATKSPAERDDFEATGNENYVSNKSKKAHIYENDSSQSKNCSSTSPKQSSKREEGWKEVVRKSSSIQTVSMSESGVKKVSVPLHAISRVIGRGGSNINAIRGATGAHIEVEKQSKGQGERIITIKGAPDVTKQAHSLIATLIKDPDVDILQMLPKTNKTTTSTTTLWDKTQIGTKKIAGKVLTVTQPSALTTTTQSKTIQTVAPSVTSSSRSSTTTVKLRGAVPIITSRVTAPRLVAQAEKNAAAQAAAVRSSVPHTSSSSVASRTTTKLITTTATQTFAAKLTETTANQLSINVSHGINMNKSRSLGLPSNNTGPISPQSVPHSTSNTHSSPKHSRPTPTASAPPNMQHYQSPGKGPGFGNSTGQANVSVPVSESSGTVVRSTTPNVVQSSTVQIQDEIGQQNNLQTPPEYSLFYSADQPMWRRDNESQKPVNFAAVTGGSNSQTVMQPKFIDQDPPQMVDVSKAPGYRGGTVCSPVSSKTSSNSTTPPNISASSASFQVYPEPSKNQPLAPIGSNIGRPQVSSQNDSAHFYSEIFKSGSANIPHNMLNMTNEGQLLQSAYHPNNSLKNLNYAQSQQTNMPLAVSMSRLNPKAPDFASTVYNAMPTKQGPQMYNGFPMPGQNNNALYSGAKAGVDSYHRSGVGSSQTRWPLMQMQQPFTQQQSELLSGMPAGMTLHSLARATGSEILESGPDLGMVNHSPNMSPNLPSAHNMHQGDGHYMEDRKQPQPIGTERARKVYANMDTGAWMFGSEVKPPGRWLNTNEQFNINRGQVYAEEMQQYIETLPPVVTLESPHNFSNGPIQPYLMQQQQQPIGRPTHTDFIQDLSWDGNRPNVNDIQDKSQHGWAGMSKWNQ